MRYQMFACVALGCWVLTPFAKADAIIACQPVANCTFSGNTVTYTESFTGGATSWALAEFYPNLDDGVGRFVADVTKIVTNNTTSTWTDFLIHYGGETILPGGRPPLPSPNGFELSTTAVATGPGTPGTLAASDYLLHWSNLSVAPGETITLTFQTFDLIGFTGGGPRSLMLQQAIGVETPEPATMFLAAGALLALGIVKRRRL